MGLQFFFNGLISGCLYAIVALSFGLIYNTTNIFHFAHGAVYVASAYLLYMFLISLQLPILTAILLSLILAALFGVCIELIIYRPFLKKKFSPNALMISSFGVYLLTVNVIALLAGNETKVLNPGIETTYTFFGTVILTRIQVLSFIVFVIILILFFMLRKLKAGKVIIAYSNNPSLTEILGWNSSIIRVSIFAVGSALASIASFLAALDVGIDPNIGMNALLVGAVAVIVGGIKIFEGALIGGILIGLIQSFVVWQFSARWMEAATFIVLIFFLLLRPQGLLGKTMRVEETQ